MSEEYFIVTARIFTPCLYIISLFFNCSQDTKNPELLVPIPEITEPLPPARSDCPTPGTVDSVASKGHLASALAVFLGVLCSVMAALK